MLDERCGEGVAHREAGVAGTDDDDVDDAGHSADAPCAEHHATSTCYVGRVRDDVEHGGALLRLRHQRRDLLLRGVGVDVEVTLMPSKPLRTSLSMPRMPWMSMPASSVALTDRS